ncbi:hypothetical protein [Actinoplanes siamensis]|uniref:DUF1648 domain-containing protein n=1 Tax=Actinoplanes siamensis TaxID=1223317 RepID=A0A919K802_9ACTN|nr:hypothetical protein [Actinoplanes siamensis]GIF02647.1 hypothetical protein Asi03nite_01850 [Actinoplanes siamensis]
MTAPSRTTVLFSSLTALVLVAIAATVVWSWRDDLPDPLASHWGGRSSVPDGFSSLKALTLSTGVLVVLLLALFAAIGWFWGSTATTRRLVAASAVWAGGFGACLLLFTAGVQRGLTDASRATLPGWAVAGLLVLPLAPAVVAALLVRKDPREPAGGPVGPDAPRLALGGDERAVWIHRADGGPGLIAGALAIAVVAVLAVVLREWALLIVPVLLAALFAAMFAFTVRVDATGLTVRSVLGWPGTHIPLEEVERASVAEVRPIREFGGWGWRVGRRGRVGVVLRAGESLLVERSADRSFVVTVGDAATGAALLNTLAERSRAA